MLSLMRRIEGGSSFHSKAAKAPGCPTEEAAMSALGSFFAKQEMLLFAALLIGNFRIQLVDDAAEIDWRYFGTGVLGVKEKQPFLLCRRERDVCVPEVAAA